MKDSIETIGKELALVQSNIATTKELQSVLSANRSIAGSQTGVSVAELTKLMDYYRSKTTELQKESLQLADKESKLTEADRTAWKARQNEAEKKNTGTAGQLAFQAFSPTAGTSTLTISYITPYAGWNPAYDLRVESISKPVNIGFQSKSEPDHRPRLEECKTGAGYLHA